MQPEAAPVIVRSDVRFAEEWVCLATRRASRPNWRFLTQHAGNYAENRFWLASSRSKLQDQVRNNLAGVFQNYPHLRGHLFVPINLSVGLDSLEPVPDLPEYVPMFPRRMPTCSTATEAMERMRITRGKDKEFARKFAGYRFIPVRIDDAVLVPK